MITKADSPEPGYPTELVSLAEYLNVSNLPLLLRQFLFDQLHPDNLPDEQLPIPLPNIHHDTSMNVFHSARAVFHAPSDASGTHGMQRQIIRATPSWRQKEARYDCVLIVEDENKPGMRGMVVGRVRCLLSFTYNDIIYPCALIDRFKRVGRSPDPVTGMWRVQPEIIRSRRGTRRIQSIVHVETILRNVHLIPVFGSGFVPRRLHFSDSLDIFTMFYVNKYADHHSFEVVV
jgi:hypothetical protein